MRIALFVEGYPNPSETFVVRHIAGLTERGHEVCVFPARYRTDLDAPDVPSATLDSLPRSGWRRAARVLSDALRATRRPVVLVRLVAAMVRYGSGQAPLLLAHVARPMPRHFDVVVGEFGTSSRRAALLIRAGALRGSLVSMFRGSDALVVPATVPDGFYDAVFDTADAVVVLTDFMTRAVEALGARPGTITKIANGVDLARFERRRPQEITPPATLDCTAVGRLVDCKGFSVAIEAIRLLHERGVDARLRIIGEGPLRHELEAQIDSAGLDGAVTLPGACDHGEVARSMRASSVVLVPGIVAPSGRVEAFGNVAVEAQALGVPVIASEVGGIPEACGPTVTLVRPGDPELLADELQRVAKLDVTDVDEAAAVSRRFVETNFDPDRQLDVFVGLLTRVVRPDAPGPTPSG